MTNFERIKEIETPEAMLQTLSIMNPGEWNVPMNGKLEKISDLETKLEWLNSSADKSGAIFCPELVCGNCAHHQIRYAYKTDRRHHFSCPCGKESNANTYVIAKLQMMKKR